MTTYWLKAHVLDLVNIHTRSDKVIALLKSSNNWDILCNSLDISRLLTDTDGEKLRVFVYGYATQCNRSNSIRFVSFSVGYRYCGTAAHCQCVKSIVSHKVSNNKQQYNQEKKDSIAKKRAETNLSKYGVDNLFKDTEKIKQSYINRLGVDNPNKLQSVRSKIDETNLSKYGTVRPAQNTDVKQKIKNTVVSTYGVDSVFKIDNVKIKSKETLLKNYGVTHQMKSAVVKQKFKNTSVGKYGFDNPSKSPEIIDNIKTAQRRTNINRVNARLHSHLVEMDQSQSPYLSVSQHFDWQCTRCNSNFQGIAINGRVPRCPTCYPKHISAGQLDVVNYVSSIVGSQNVIVNDRKFLENTNDKRKSKELDIFIPSANFAIEFCGLRYHTEGYGKKHKLYHYEKMKACAEKNTTLMTIFSDEWYDKTALLKSMIASRLGYSNKIAARKTKLLEITKDRARDFLEKNHINGYINSTVNLALIYNDIIYMCMSISKPRYNRNFQYEITRMATLAGNIVVGGASKLFSYAVDMLHADSVISYCDLRYGSGKSYLNMGFSKYSHPTIGYQYVNINDPWCRYDRLHYQKHKLGDTGGLTESDYMNMLGFERIWDCGQQKFVWYRR